MPLQNFAATEVNVIRNFVWHKALNWTRSDYRRGFFRVFSSSHFSLFISATIWQPKRNAPRLARRDTVIVMMLMEIRLRLFISRFLPGSPFSVSYPWCHLIEIKVHHKSGIITSGIGVLNMNFSHLIRHSEWGTVFSFIHSFIFIAGFWRLRLVLNHRCQCLLYNRNKLPLWCKSNAQKDKHDSAHGTPSDTRLYPHQFLTLSDSTETCVHVCVYLTPCIVTEIGWGLIRLVLPAVVVN